ncbi:MAG: hypothetical protein JKP98_05860 [Rhodobacteraceae bacterium]|nr:hypothetical protein [Paracoccaceae bacterium]
MGRASKTDPPLTAGRKRRRPRPCRLTAPPCRPGLPGASPPRPSGRRSTRRASRTASRPGTRCRRGTPPLEDQIRIARGIGIVLAALALAMLVYVVQSGDLITGIVVLAFATLAGRFLLWPAFENGLNDDVGRKEIWGGFHRCMYDEWNDERRNEDLSQPVPGGLGPYSEFVYGRDSSDD